MVNVKEIIKCKLAELDQMLNQILINVVKVLEREKQEISEKLRQVEERYELVEKEYKKNLEARHDCLDYLNKFRKSAKAL